MENNIKQRDELYRTKLNLETSRIGWQELQRFFASGAIIYVAAELDLVEAAFQISEDNKAVVLDWMTNGKIARATDEQAQAWHEQNAELWAVVVSPYVLVQEDKNCG